MTGQFFSTLDRRIGWLLNATVIVSSVMLVGLMLFLVLSRYVFGWSVVGLLELIMVFGMWLYMIGALIASRKREHLVVDFLHQNISDRRLRHMHRLLVSAVTLIICIFFAYLSYRMLKWGMRRPQHTPGLSIPLWLPQMSIMVASVGCTLYALRDLIHAFIRLKNNEPEGRILSGSDGADESASVPQARADGGPDRVVPLTAVVPEPAKTADTTATTEPERNKRVEC